MKISERYELEIDLIINVIVSAIYMGGIALVHIFIDPLFGASDVPTLPVLFMLIGDLILLLAFIIRLIRTLDLLWQTLTKTKIWQDASPVFSKAGLAIVSRFQKGKVRASVEEPQDKKL